MHCLTDWPEPNDISLFDPFYFQTISLYFLKMVDYYVIL